MWYFGDESLMSIEYSFVFERGQTCLVSLDTQLNYSFEDDYQGDYVKFCGGHFSLFVHLTINSEFWGIHLINFVGC